MAWRISESVLSGRLDFTDRGKVTGTLAVEGRAEPVRLVLEGLPWADLAGHRLAFERKSGCPVPIDEGFASEQSGSVGDMTASRKVRRTDHPAEAIVEPPSAEVPWTWENCLYLEWYSERNGRVVFRSTEFALSLEPVGAWELGPHEAPPASGTPVPFLPFVGDPGHPGSSIDPGGYEAYLPDEDDAPKSAAEAEADREAARMDLLLDRIGRRLEKEGRGEGDFERIMEEERERLRRELGEPEPEPLTPEEEAERERWIEEMNAAAAEAAEDPDFWDEEDDDEEHPLVEEATVVGTWLWHELVERAGGWSALTPEHPFIEIAQGVQFASAKLAGALNGTTRRGEWPPDSLTAGDCLVRLKKARGHLLDAVAGARSAEEDGLLGGIRLDEINGHITALQGTVERLIAEVREAMG